MLSATSAALLAAATAMTLAPLTTTTGWAAPGTTAAAGPRAPGTGSISLCRPGSEVRTVGTKRRLVTLTFDDGPSAQTRDFVEVLHAAGVPGTLFVVGAQVRQQPDALRFAVRRGFTIGNHSMTHRYNPQVIADEIAPVNRMIARISGTRPIFFRSPGLTRSPVITARLKGSTQCHIATDVDLGDWKAPRHTSRRICADFAAALHPGLIALFHDGPLHTQTLAALPCIIRSAQDRGYTFVGLEELLTQGPALTDVR